MFILGIDPSERHTGLCLLNTETQVTTFDEIQTPADTDLLTSVLTLKKSFREVVAQYTANAILNGYHSPVPNPVFAIEKQVMSGHSSLLLFYVQMAVYEEIAFCSGHRPIRMVAPLPIQLKSYVKKRFGIDTASKSSMVQGYQKLVGDVKRISSHKVDAYFLARMAAEVMKGTWKYTRPAREAPLVPWQTLYGEENGSRSESNSDDQTSTREEVQG